MSDQTYRNPEMSMYYWRTSTGLEVDFILGDMEVAIEVKSSQRVHETDTKGLQALSTSHMVKKQLLVSFESEPRMLGNSIECLPWKNFLEKLWNEEII